MDRHRFHAICPYFAMFPEQFVQKYLVYSKPKDIVLDPFSGRGTTVFQSLLMDRKGIGLDISPVAVCVSRAKANAPSMDQVLVRLNELSEKFRFVDAPEFRDEFFRMCFSKTTLSQIIYLRSELKWRQDHTDCYLAATLLGRLHGESHRSPNYLSNQMPRTISTKPDYSVRWWRKRNLHPPERDAFEVIRNDILYRFASARPKGKGLVKEGDVRTAAKLLKPYKGKVKLVITSPPYLDTTNFAEDQWLRNWCLGESSRSGFSKLGDHRHTSQERYWKFIQDSFSGFSPLLAENATVVMRIGGSKLQFDEALTNLRDRLKKATGQRIRTHASHQSKISDGQLRSFRPGIVGTKREFDFVFRLS